jgi:hypothetical protein
LLIIISVNSISYRESLQFCQSSIKTKLITWLCSIYPVSIMTLVLLLSSFFHTYFKKLNVLTDPFISAQHQNTSLSTDPLSSFCNLSSSSDNCILTLFLWILVSHLIIRVFPLFHNQLVTLIIIFFSDTWLSPDISNTIFRLDKNL